MNGDKSNDLWELNLETFSWTCIDKGTYLQPPSKNPSCSSPPPRIGAKLLFVDNCLILHNGHDAENEKLADLWKFDLRLSKWTQLEQKGDVPQGRNGHSLSRYKDYLIMFGGIFDITKESEEFFVLHLPSLTWKQVDTAAGPVSLSELFHVKP